MNIIFIVGPGGVGKTSCGEILSKNINYDFIDLDVVFCEDIKNITDYIKEEGYKSYCYKNSELFEFILNEIKQNTVFVLSSGFLVHEELESLVKKHLNLISSFGISILILPDKDIDRSTQIVVGRQMKRPWKLCEEKEALKFRSRFNKYLKFGDIKIFSLEKPDVIAKIIEKALKDKGFMLI